MNKVYFNKNLNVWWLKELEDFYTIDCVDFDTKQKSNYIISWTRNFDVSPYESDGVVRLYDIEIKSEKYFFFVIPTNGGFILKPKDSYELDRLAKDTNLSVSPPILE